MSYLSVDVIFLGEVCKIQGIDAIMRWPRR